MRVNVTAASISGGTIVALFVFYPFFSISFYKGYFLLVLVGLFVTLFADLLIKRGRLWFDARPIAVYVFFLVPLVSVLWAKYPGETIWHGLLVLVNIAIFYLACRANAYAITPLISRIVIVVPVAVLLVFTLILIKYGAIRPRDAAMASDIGAVSNEFSAIVILCLPYLLALQRRKKREFLIYISLAACVVSVILSQSRGAYLMFVIAAFLSIRLFTNRLSHYFLGLVGLGVVVLFFVVTLELTIGLEQSVGPVIDRFRESQLIDPLVALNLEPDKNKPDYARTVMYAEGVKTILEEPLRGIGYRGLSRFIEDRYGFPMVSHNLIITVWGEMGLLGLFILIWLISAVIFQIHKQLKNKYLSQEEKHIMFATSVALVVAFLHAQFRPSLLNPMVPVLLAQVYARGDYWTRYRSNAMSLSVNTIDES